MSWLVGIEYMRSRISVGWSRSFMYNALGPIHRHFLGIPSMIGSSRVTDRFNSCLGLGPIDSLIHFTCRCSDRLMPVGICEVYVDVFACAVCVRGGL